MNRCLVVLMVVFLILEAGCQEQAAPKTPQKAPAPSAPATSAAPKAVEVEPKSAYRTERRLAFRALETSEDGALIVASQEGETVGLFACSAEGTGHGRLFRFEGEKPLRLTAYQPKFLDTSWSQTIARAFRVAKSDEAIRCPAVMDLVLKRLAFSLSSIASRVLEPKEQRSGILELGGSENLRLGLDFFDANGAVLGEAYTGAVQATPLTIVGLLRCQVRALDLPILDREQSTGLVLGPRSQNLFVIAYQGDRPIAYSPRPARATSFMRWAPDAFCFQVDSSRLLEFLVVSIESAEELAALEEVLTEKSREQVLAFLKTRPGVGVAGLELEPRLFRDGRFELDRQSGRLNLEFLKGDRPSKKPAEASLRLTAAEIPRVNQLGQAWERDFFEGPDVYLEVYATTYAPPPLSCEVRFFLGRSKTKEDTWTPAWFWKLPVPRGVEAIVVEAFDQDEEGPKGRGPLVGRAFLSSESGGPFRVTGSEGFELLKAPRPSRPLPAGASTGARRCSVVQIRPSEEEDQDQLVYLAAQDRPIHAGLARTLPHGEESASFEIDPSKPLWIIAFRPASGHERDLILKGIDLDRLSEFHSFDASGFLRGFIRIDPSDFRCGALSLRGGFLALNFTDAGKASIGEPYRFRKFRIAITGAEIPSLTDSGSHWDPTISGTGGEPDPFVTVQLVDRFAPKKNHRYAIGATAKASDTYRANWNQRFTFYAHDPAGLTFHLFDADVAFHDEVGESELVALQAGSRRVAAGRGTVIITMDKGWP